MIQERCGDRGGECQELHQPPECPEHRVSHLRHFCQNPAQAHHHQDSFRVQSRSEKLLTGSSISFVQLFSNSVIKLIVVKLNLRIIRCRVAVPGYQGGSPLSS